MERAGLNLLSLDEGGVRGLSSLIILKALMAKLNEERRASNLLCVKPCEVFDLIGGTSTGGYIQ
jgi:patatin-like phospholipase/acyl hydrolase